MDWKIWKNEKKAELMVKALQSREFDVELINNLEAARNRILELIPERASVAVGGSVTLEEMGLLSYLREGNYYFYDRYLDVPFDEKVKIYRESITADYLITSVNAVTENGELVLSDSSGNRISSLVFGACHAIVVIGCNKLVKNIEAAFERIREIEPMNCKRNGHTTISSETGFFTDEVSPMRMMNVSCILHYGGKFPHRIKVLVLKTEAGY